MLNLFLMLDGFLILFAVVGIIQWICERPERLVYHEHNCACCVHDE